MNNKTDRYHQTVNDSGSLDSLGDEPAVISRFEDGSVYRKMWYKDGNIHRGGDLPAILEYYRNGNISSEIYSINNDVHRENGYSKIEYYNSINSPVMFKISHKQGEIHSNEGAALIKYTCKGEVIIKKYFDNGIELEGEDLVRFKRKLILMNVAKNDNNISFDFKNY